MVVVVNCCQHCAATFMLIDVCARVLAQNLPESLLLGAAARCQRCFVDVQESKA